MLRFNHDTSIEAYQNRQSIALDWGGSSSVIGPTQNDLQALGRVSQYAPAQQRQSSRDIRLVHSGYRPAVYGRSSILREGSITEEHGMIRTIYSNELTSFKTLGFKPGLNILLADKSEGATDKQSRNGAGKSSFVELVHFLFGSGADQECVFRHKKLENYSFSAVFELAGSTVKVTRRGEKPSKIYIEAEQTDTWPIKPTRGKAGLSFTNEQWKLLLGNLMFGLPVDNEYKQRYLPKFRMLFSYFARRANDNGFTEPTKYFDKQQTWDEQVAISYLLGLDCSIPQAFQEVREKEKTIAELKKIVKQGNMPEVLENASDLKTRLTIVEDRAKKLKVQLDSFRVVPEYTELEKEASKLTRKMNELANDNTSDRELLDKLQSSLEQEKPPAFANLDNLYQEAGIVLPDNIVRRFEDVQVFHEKIVANRKAHLKAEMHSVAERIENRDRNKTTIDRRRSEVMQVLQTGGALEHYTGLQGEYSKMQAQVETLRQKLDVAEQIERDKTSLTIERAQLYRRLQDDYHERDEILKESILIFENLSNSLYDKAGSLIVEPGQNGPHFEVKIDSQRSKGINNMQIFCFDLMLTELSHRHGIGPGFLIHDSHLFDGVDERQKAKAFELGHRKASELGIQYIVTMNSDDMPWDSFSSEFKINDYILSPRLADTENGGLFGIHF